MADPQQILHLADELRDWAPVAVYAIRFGVKQAHAIVARFQEHYKHDAPETRKLAAENAADATQRIYAELDRLVERGEVTEEEIRRNYARPDIAKHVQDLILAASETPDELSHQGLAALVAARLVASRDSESSILLRMAADKLRYLNAVQLKMLGLTYAVLHMNVVISDKTGPNAGFDDGEYAEYLAQLRAIVGPFRELGPPRALEFMHFEELGLAKLSSWTVQNHHFSPKELSQSPLFAPLAGRFYGKMITFIDAASDADAMIKWISALLNGDLRKDVYGLQTVRLTPVGQALGKCMYCVTHGEPFRLRPEP